MGFAIFPFLRPANAVKGYTGNSLCRHSAAVNRCTIISKSSKFLSGIYHIRIKNELPQKICAISMHNDQTGEDSSAAFSSTFPVVKMCGITSGRDAVLAAEAGANMIGMILWPKSKRSVPLDVAKEISRLAKEYGAEPVGVFVDEDTEQIERVCDAVDINVVQLHGDNPRSALLRLGQDRCVIYVLHADKEGNILTELPTKERLVDWILVDSLVGGSGKAFDWRKLQLPKKVSKHGWLLAGGLNPENVSHALMLLRPNAVDVSSGICAADGIQKDPTRVSAFMKAIKQSQYV